MNIRRLNMKDYDDFVGLLSQLHEMHVENRPDFYIESDEKLPKEVFDKKINDINSVFIGAEIDGKLAGVCYGYVNDKSGMVPMNVADLRGIVVAKDFRSLGVARALFSEFEKITLSMNVKRIDLTVWSFNSGAINLYESLGMVPQRIIYEKNYD